MTWSALKSREEKTMPDPDFHYDASVHGIARANRSGYLTDDEARAALDSLSNAEAPLFATMIRFVRNRFMRILRRSNVR